MGLRVISQCGLRQCSLKNDIATGWTSSMMFQKAYLRHALHRHMFGFALAAQYPTASQMGVIDGGLARDRGGPWEKS